MNVIRKNDMVRMEQTEISCGCVEICGVTERQNARRRFVWAMDKSDGSPSPCVWRQSTVLRIHAIIVAMSLLTAMATPPVLAWLLKRSTGVGPVEVPDVRD